MFASIFFDILAPILVLVAAGAFLRWRFRIDIATLSKVNLYLTVPAFIFHKVAHSQMPWSEMGIIVGATTLQVFLLGVLVAVGGRLLGVARGTLSTVALSVMFYNSGNFGLPLAELAYPSGSGLDGGAVQAFVLMTQNLLTFTVGLVIASSGNAGPWWRAILQALQLPMLPALLLALVARWWLGVSPDNHLPIAIGKPLEYLAAALIPVALVTLGAQLATNPRWPRWKPVGAVMLLRLAAAPALMAGILAILSAAGLIGWPWPAQLIILTAGVPTAINTLLLTLELGGDAELSADCVFWTTLGSCISLTVLLLIVKSCFPG